MNSAEVRQTFLSYFAERGHTIVPSASLIPPRDPTLLFVNAGMVPFKDVFLGLETRPYTRAASSQRCLRVSGKHNDLEEVGTSFRHHTFFEMLGNFSFGDYFKEEALEFSWDFLTRVLGIDGARLHPTVYEEDDESARIWAKIKAVPERAVVRLGAEDNFWSMGDTGPCGPNSEIIYDRTGRCLRDGSDCPLTCECERWWELWNDVFMQFDRAADGTLTPLARHGVDTGMGLERLTAVLQGVETDYDIDLFVPLIDRLRTLTDDTNIPPEKLVSYRAVADHARAVSFLIADGVAPSNEGRGYVLRRILRRASYQGRLLGLDRSFLAEICDAVIELMGSTFSEVREASPRILATVAEEEERFLSTLEAGLTRLEQAIEGRTHLPGDEAFRLYDTYGFPIDLTRKVLEARGATVDEAGFNAALEEQRARAREALARERRQDWAALSPIRDLPSTSFVGYEALTSTSDALLLFAGDAVLQVAEQGEELNIVLDATPFYAEAGGQVGDRGRITGPDGEAQIETVHSIAHGVYVHSGRVIHGELRAGDRVRAVVDESARRATMRNHTATHLLHRALRVVLGPQAKQAGSLVAPDRLRFDFLHNRPLTDDELHEAERIVREQIMLDRPVHTEVLPLQQALDLGADAMFDEKYGQEARVVTVANGEVFSRELCGGTHCRATGEIGAFVIVDQRSVGAGVRRVDALTGAAAYALLDAQRRLVEQLSREYRTTAEQLPERLRALQEQAAQTPRRLAAALPDPADILARAHQRDGTHLIVDWIDGADAAALRDFGDELRRRAKSAAVVLGAEFEGKLNVTVMLTDDLVRRGLHAGKLAKEIGAAMGAGGGGRPDVATAGGDPARREAGLAKARELLAAAT
jgi:alanyl-tRNA synthetase